MTKNFQVALTADFYDASGKPRYPNFGLDVFSKHPQIAIEKFSEHRSEITADQLSTCNSALVLTPKVTGASLAQCENLLSINRFGVGYDAVDIAACTANNVLVTITPGAVDRPVAEATVAWMLALTHRLLQKDRLIRTCRWDERSLYMGCELRDRTLGVVGLGGIGRQLVQLLQGFGMRQPLAFDPFADLNAFAELGVRRVDLDDLLTSADFVSLHCPLTDQTRGLIGDEQLQKMKPSAYLLNLARGGIVDEHALYQALKSGRIAGAALDCFAEEPVSTPHPLAELENVLLAPHSIAWTEELFRDIGRTACQSILDLSRGVRPFGIVNPQVLEQPDFQSKWERVQIALL